MSQPQKLVVKYRPLKSLKPNERNARLHSPEQIDQIARSIAEFGFTNPILLKDDGETIGAGHGRFEAARKAGLASVPTITLTGLTEAQWRAYVIADNQLALTSTWNMEVLAAEVAALKIEMPDLDILGFSQVEIGEILQTLMPDKTEEEEEAVPEPPAEPVARTGDIWALGKHRLMCGDSTSADCVARLLDGAKPHLMVTDPPYGVNYDPKWRDELGIDWTGVGDKKRKSAQRLSTHPDAKPLKSRSLGKVENDDRADWKDAWDIFPGNIAYVWHGGLHAGVVQDSLSRSGFTIRAQIIWVKQHFVFSRGDYHWRHEPCWYAVRGTGNWTGDRKQTSVWEIANASAFHGEKDDTTTGHGTQKPVECMRKPIENNSQAGDYVYEPFCGSGTTIIAAETTGRRCLAMELSPAYCDVIVSRWETFTGQKAVLLTPHGEE